MIIQIANFYDAPRRTAVAGEAIPQGAVIKLTAAADGQRKAMKLTDSDSALLVFGKYGVAVKISARQYQVTQSLFGVPSDWGSRITTIVSGDQIVEVGRGAILEYDPSLLHDSLNPANGGALPVVGDTMAIKGGLFAAASASGAITSPVVARCFDVLGGRVRIELV